MTGYTVTVETDSKRRRYELNDAVMQYVESIARAAYDDNEWVELFWDEFDKDFETEPDLPTELPRTNYGDPVLTIHTSGQTVPLRRVVQPQEARTIEPDDDDVEIIDDPSTEGEENSGTAVTMVPNTEDEDRESFDVAKIVNGEIDTREEQLADGRLPRKPELEDEVPHYIQLVPEQSGEVWATADSLLPVTDKYYWNLQARIDYPPTEADASKAEREKARQTAHNNWDELLQSLDCEVIDEESLIDESDESERKAWDYDSTDADETVDSGEVGARWNV